ncbi:MAG: acyl-CoA dehydrogenase [Rhizobiales bacterium]|nr:acyl-CoA dehydrogenase [Hyphomicrobiales bacterium]
MDFQLSDDQRQMQEMALEFARERLAPNAADWDERAHFPVDVLREAAGLGMGAMLVSEAHGGSGLSRLDAALLYEALSTGCPTIAAYLSIHNMVAVLLERYGSDDQRARYLSRLVSMDWLSSYCLTEPGSGSDAAALKTRAVRDGDHYVLDGAKQFISGAGTSDLYLVMVRTGGDGAKGISAILVEGATPGVSFGGLERKMGWNAQPTRTVTFDGARVPVANRLGEEGEGFRFAMIGLDGGRVNIAACSLGAATAAMEAARTYMGERRAFGAEISSFQALQFKLADMATELDAARLMVYRAAASLDRGDPDATKHCAMAKRFATDVGFSAANEALQIHGGYGYLKDYGLEKIVRDLRVHQILEGTNEIMRVIIARKLLAAN